MPIKDNKYISLLKLTILSIVLGLITMGSLFGWLIYTYIDNDTLGADSAVILFLVAVSLPVVSLIYGTVSWLIIKYTKHKNGYEIESFRGHLTNSGSIWIRVIGIISGVSAMIIPVTTCIIFLGLL